MSLYLRIIRQSGDFSYSETSVSDSTCPLFRIVPGLLLHVQITEGALNIHQTSSLTRHMLTSQVRLWTLTVLNTSQSTLSEHGILSITAMLSGHLAPIDTSAFLQPIENTHHQDRAQNACQW